MCTPVACLSTSDLAKRNVPTTWSHDYAETPSDNVIPSPQSPLLPAEKEAESRYGFKRRTCGRFRVIKLGSKEAISRRIAAQLPAAPMESKKSVCYRKAHTNVSLLLVFLSAG